MWPAPTGPLTLSSATDLRDALVATASGDTPNSPSFRVGRDDAEPAWAWLGRLVAARSDWRQAAVLALSQILALGDGAHAVVLCDLFATDRAAALLRDGLDEAVLDGLRGTQGTVGTLGFGGTSTPTLGAVLDGQAAMLRASRDPTRRVIFDAWVGPFTPRLVTLADDAATVALLADTADLGKAWPSSWTNGPWGWTAMEELFRDGFAASLATHVGDVVAAEPERIWTALAWLGHGWDVRRFHAVLADWQASPPVALISKTDHIPKGWRYPPLASFAGAKTIGDVLQTLCDAAALEVSTAPQP